MVRCQVKGYREGVLKTLLKECKKIPSIKVSAMQVRISSYPLYLRFPWFTSPPFSPKLFTNWCTNTENGINKTKRPTKIHSSLWIQVCTKSTSIRSAWLTVCNVQSKQHSQLPASLIYPNISVKQRSNTQKQEIIAPIKLPVYWLLVWI